MDANYLRQRLMLAITKLAIADALHTFTGAGKDKTQWAVELVTLRDDSTVYGVYEDAKLRHVETAYVSGSPARKLAIESVVNLLLSKGVTLDGINTVWSGARRYLWNVSVKQIPLNGTAGWVFTGSPYTQALKTVHLRPMERHQSPVYGNNGKSRTTITAIKQKVADRVTKEQIEHTWLQRSGLCYAMGSRGNEFKGYVQLRSINLLSMGNIPFEIIRCAGYANRNHLMSAWADEYKDYRKSQPVWVFGLTPLSPCAVNVIALPTPADDYTDLPIFKFVQTLVAKAG